MASVSVDKLKKVVDRALTDNAYAERIFNNPDTVAQEHGLSDDEKLVLKQMDREKFDTARRDAEEKASREKSGELSDTELAGVAGGAFASMPSALGTASAMIIGRSILNAQGTSYKNLNAACDCCAWKGGAIAGGMVSNPA